MSDFNEFTDFLYSPEAPLICSVLIAVGVVDLLIKHLVFGAKLKKLAASIEPTMSPQEKMPLEYEIKKLKIIGGAFVFTGILFIALGIFGLTYKH